MSLSPEFTPPVTPEEKVVVAVARTVRKIDAVVNSKLADLGRRLDPAAWPDNGLDQNSDYFKPAMLARTKRNAKP